MKLGLDKGQLAAYGTLVHQKVKNINAEKLEQEAIDMREKQDALFESMGITYVPSIPIPEMMSTIKEIDNEWAIFEAVAAMITANNAAVAKQLEEALQK